MNTNQTDLLPTRLNFDAIVFMGCTRKELIWLSLSSIISCALILGVLTKLMFGMLLVGVGLSFPVAVGVTCFGALTLQRLKQGKPKGYLKQSLLIRLERNGIQKSPFVTRSGKWSTERFL